MLAPGAMPMPPLRGVYRAEIIPVRLQHWDQRRTRPAGQDLLQERVGDASFTSILPRALAPAFVPGDEAGPRTPFLASS